MSAGRPIDKVDGPEDPSAGVAPRQDVGAGPVESRTLRVVAS
jgi:hypothetical protein